MTVGDWIKMRSSLASDPKVNAIGKHLEQNPRFFYWLTCDQHSELSLSDNALRHVVTGALHNVWSNANQHCENGVLKHADLSWIDNTCGVPGFGVAMSSVGWVVAETGCLIFPKFNDNNTSAAERQKKYRERKKGQEHNGDVTRNVTRDNGVTPREEKIREDKKREEHVIKPEKKQRAKLVEPAIPESLNTPEFLECWDEWKAHRKEKKVPLTPTSVRQQFRDFEKWGIPRAIAAMRYTIGKGWQGIAEPTSGGNQGQFAMVDDPLGPDPLEKF